MSEDLSADEAEPLEARVDELESRVEDLRDTVETQQDVINFLAADADISMVSGDCPECRNGTLERRSGLSWAKLTCDDCGTEWVL